jgi:hypothetical protein
MLTNVDNLATKLAKTRRCESCDYVCSKKSDMDKHILTLKHQNVDKMLTNVDIPATNLAVPLMETFICECGKKYKHRQSLSIHRKKCHKNVQNAEDTTLNDKELILTLIQQNSQLQNQIIELCKTTNNTIITNNGNINSNNKTFNLNVFLNETCKDAMNIMDFVDSINLQLSDLESFGNLGYVEGISSIIVKNLKEMDVHKRPVHCSDSKREVMYIKDDNKWEKLNEEKTKLRKLIKRVAHKNSRLLPQYKEKHPDCDTRLSEQYNKLIIEAMGGLGDNLKEKEDKIISKIAKEVTIDKIHF